MSHPMLTACLRCDSPIWKIPQWLWVTPSHKSRPLLSNWLYPLSALAMAIITDGAACNVKYSSGVGAWANATAIKRLRKLVNISLQAQECQRFSISYEATSNEDICRLGSFDRTQPSDYVEYSTINRPYCTSYSTHLCG